MTVYEAPEHRMGGEIYYREDKYRHDPELLEAYHCGHKDGRKEAYKEIMEEQYGGSYHHRDRWREMPPMYRDEHPMHDGHPMYRDDFRMPEHDEIVYRRGRDARGRYI